MISHILHPFRFHRSWYRLVAHVSIWGKHISIEIPGDKQVLALGFMANYCCYDALKGVGGVWR